MFEHIVPYLLHFIAQTVILVIALFMMIKFQKLEFNFPGLVVAAAISIAVEFGLNFVIARFLDEMFAVYVTTPLVCLVLIIGISKVTQAESVDVLFTVFVGYAVEFCLKLFILGALLGDLSEMHRAKDVDGFAAEMATVEPAATNNPAAAKQVTNKVAKAAAKAPEKKVTATKADAKPVEPAKATKGSFFSKLTKKSSPSEPEKAAPSSGKSKEDVTSRQIKAATRGLTLKGISRSKTKSMAMIHSGSRNYTIVVGEELAIDTSSGRIPVRCEEITEESVILTISGERIELYLP